MTPSTRAKVAGILVNMDLADLQEVNRMLRTAFESHRRTAVKTFHAGDKVHFTHSKTGAIVNGTVTQVNKVSVNLMATTGMRWKVGASLLVAGHMAGADGKVAGFPSFTKKEA